MATRRRPPASPTDDPGLEDDAAGAIAPHEISGAALVDVDGPELQTAADRVMHMLAGVADDERAKLTVHQVLPNGREAWCEDYSPADYEIGGTKMIRDKWGAGTFKLRLYGVRDGHFGILTSATVVVKESRDPPAAAAAPNNDALRLIAEGQQQMLRALTERPALDPMADMAKMFGMMKMMRDAMGLDAQPAPAPQRSTVSELVDAIKELRGASELISPSGGDNDDSLAGMAKAFIPMIASMAGNRRAGADQVEQLPAPVELEAQPGPPQDTSLGRAASSAGPITTWPALHEEAGAPAELPIGTDVGIISPEALTTFKLRAYLASLVMMARTKVSTDKGAELVYEKLPDEWIDMLDLPTWWELFSQACPDAIPYQVWFTEVRDKALQLFTAGDDGEDETVPPPASSSSAGARKAS